MKTLTTSLLLVTALLSQAANYCVGPSASGDGSGSDWNNRKAWTDTPARGDVWYLRDGTYASKTLSTARSGTTLCTIKKATTADHVTDTGWSSSYANQAAIASLTISSSYWLIDGVTGDGASVCPYDGTASHYGIAFTATDNVIYFTGGLTDVNIKHCSFFSTINGPTGIYEQADTDVPKTNIVVSHCLFDGFNEILRNNNSAWYSPVFEYNVVVNSQGSGEAEQGGNAQHGNPINIMWRPMYDLVVRNNVFFNWSHLWTEDISGVIGGNGADMVRAQIYGNVFDSLGATVFIIGGNNISSVDVIDCVAHHNTFISSPSWYAYNAMGGFGSASSGNTASNNLFYSMQLNNYYRGSWTHNYGAWYNANDGFGVPTKEGESQGQIASGNPFVNLATHDYRLATNTSQGATLTGGVATDPLGNTRSTWTRGAFEFNGTPADTNNPIIALSDYSHDFGILKVSWASNTVVSVTNTGNGTLTGAASASAPYSVSNGSYSLTNGQYQDVTITYTPTAATESSGTVSFTGAAGASVSVLGKSYTNQFGTNFLASAGTVIGQMSRVNNYVISTADFTSAVPNSLVLIGFSLASPGYYYLSAYVLGTNGATDSFFVNIDAAPTDPNNIYDMATNGVSSTWRQQTVSWRGLGGYSTPDYPTNLWYLGAGDHALRIHARENYAAISNIAIIEFVTNAPVIAPTILQQPSGLYLTNLGAGTMTVEAIGTEPLAYQWRHAGTNLTGETTTSLSLSDVGAEHAGDYDVVITNEGGSVTSVVAVVEVVFPPILTAIPVATNILIGNQLQLLGNADSLLNSDWRKDGLVVAFNTNTLTKTVTVSDSGLYTYTAYNGAGQTSSAPVRVFVFQTPSMTVETITAGSVTTQ